MICSGRYGRGNFTNGRITSRTEEGSGLGTVAKKHFDYGEREINYLRCADAALGAAMARLGRVERVIMPDPFAALVHAIVGQLVSVKAANTVWERMQERLGRSLPGILQRSRLNGFKAAACQ